MLSLAGWLVLVLVVLGQTRSAPARPLANVRLGGVNYVEAKAFGASLGMTFKNGPGGAFSLTSRWTTIKGEVDSREGEINGQRVFFGDPVRGWKGQPMLARIDVDTLLTPILLPGSHQARVPNLKVIAIDPGHGGRDSGKVNAHVKVKEKSLALDTALRLKRILETDGYRVVLTRSDDRYVELADRATIARKAGADLFLSVHYNSVETGADRVTGVEVFTMTPQYQYSTSDPERGDSGAKLRNPGNANDHWNTILGYRVHRELLETLKVPDRGLKRARWAVLRLASCPAILIEAGYLSNDAEARRIAAPEYRQRIATAIADGVRGYASVLDGARRAAQARKS